MDPRANNLPKQYTNEPIPKVMIKKVDVPEAWGSCPISGIGIMHPVIGKDGQRYEAKALLIHCQASGNKSPFTRELVLPVIYDYALKQELDANVEKLDGRYDEYDHKSIMTMLNRLASPVHRQRISQQEPSITCDSPWIKTGAKAVGTAFAFSMAALVAYSQLHPGEHTEDAVHMQADANNAMVAPIFYITLFLDLGIRKINRHQFGIFGAIKNAAAAFYNRQTQQQNHDVQPGPQMV